VQVQVPIQKVFEIQV